MNKVAPVFQFTDYKVFLRDRVARNRHTRGYQTILAKAAGCQRSFLSQVLNGHIHLTLDHAAGMARAIPVEDAGAEYFVELVNHARAGSPALRSLIEKRLRQIQSRQLHLGERFKEPQIPSREAESMYYASWHWCALHVISSIPRFQTARAVAERLHLPQDFVEQSLSRLQDLGLVRPSTSGKWEVEKRSVHLPKESPWVVTHHANWRQRAMLSAQIGDEEAIHYTAIHALSRRDMETVRGILLAAIEQTREVVAPSKEEDMVCVTCDFFRV